MKTLALRTQLLFVIFFIWLYSVCVGLSYWVQSQAHAKLEESFHQELSVLSQLPRLRDALRQLDLLTDNYLLTGNTRWLDKRQNILTATRRMEKDLPELLSADREREAFKDMDMQLSSYLAEQSQWIARKQGGRLSTADAAKIISRRRIFDELIERLIAIKDMNMQALERRRLDVHQATMATLAMILGTGLAAGAFIAFFLSRYLVGPIAKLQLYVKQWKLGREWDLEYPPSSPEMAELFSGLKDMTKRLNQQYEGEQELGRLKSQLVSMVSHEFNNALSVISGVSVLLEGSEPGHDKRRESYYEILKSHIKALGLASSNLLNMGRLEAGRFAVKPRRVDIRTLLEDAVKRLDILSQRKQLHISVDLPGGPVLTYIDPEAVAVVATNLLSNAIKYTPEKGRITVGIDSECAEPKKVSVYFQDTGIGISPEDQKRIFSGYYRAESGKKVAKGFGVGLTLARNIVEAHGGVLKVESKPGKGARFSFTLSLWDGCRDGESADLERADEKAAKA